MKAPAFQFYPADFLADENVALMTNQEIGCYIKLMCYCWREGSIPSDVAKIARLCGEDGLAMAELWTAICSCFDTAIDDPSRLIHPRLESERKKQIEFRSERSESGKKGANARWNNDLSKNGKAMAEPLSEPMANDGSSSSSSSSSSELKPPHTPPPKKSSKKFDASTIELPACIPKEVWEKWVEYRRQANKPISKSAASELVGKMIAWHHDGFDLALIVSTSIANDWTGLFPKKESQQRGFQPASEPRRQARQVYS
jgi:uncharacterized protein YdaU (DUF1376 family)